MHHFLFQSIQLLQHIDSTTEIPTLDKASITSLKQGIFWQWKCQSKLRRHHYKTFPIVCGTITIWEESSVFHEMENRAQDKRHRGIEDNSEIFFLISQ